MLKLYKGGGGDETLRKLLIDALAETPTGTLRKHDFRMTDLSGGNFSTKLGAAEPVDMTKAVFLKADVSEATFRKANCNGAHFIEAICVDTSFKQAKLQGANFRHSILINADFSGADIRGCDVSGAKGGTKWDRAVYDDKTVFPVPGHPPAGTIFVPKPPTRPCLTWTRDFLHIVSSYLRRPTWTFLLPTDKTPSKLPGTWNEVHDPKTDKVYYYQVDDIAKPQWTRPRGR